MDKISICLVLAICGAALAMVGGIVNLIGFTFSIGMAQDISLGFMVSGIIVFLGAVFVFVSIFSNYLEPKAKQSVKRRGARA